jgi:hypothetical protein
VGLFPGTLKYVNRFSLQIANAVQVDFGRLSVFMPKIRWMAPSGTLLPSIMDAPEWRMG